jgi:hypothetical protein
MKGWGNGISSLETSFLNLFKVAVAKPPDKTKGYTNKGSSQAQLPESGPSLQQLQHLDLNRLCFGET